MAPRNTDRRLQQALEALTESRGRLQSALDASKTGTWRWNIRENTVDCDDNLNRLLGLPPGRTATTIEELIALVHADDREKVVAARNRSPRDSASATLEYRVVWPDGTLHWIDDRASTVAGDDNAPLYMTGTCVEMTSRKAADQVVRDIDARKDNFLALLAHELRHPVGPIRNGLEVLHQLASGGGAQAAEAYAAIDRQIAHLLRLIDDLLDASRIAKCNIAMRKERCNLGHIVQQTVDDYRPVFRDRGIVVTMPAPAGDLWVDGDATRLAQIVSNILHNASTFTPAGGWVTVTLSRETQTGGVSVRIADTGIGVDAEMLGRMFAPFAQAVQHDGSLRSGLGLGLTVVRGVMEMHGGTAEAASEGTGTGTVITLHFPPAADVPERPAQRAAKAAHSLRVLVVEDNVDAAESLRAILELLGHTARTVYLGADAIRAAAESVPDVVLCDIGLPGGMDGYEVARRFRASESLAGVHLVALTGWGHPDDERRSLDAGFDLHLTKPVDPDHLEAVLARFAEGRAR